MKTFHFDHVEVVELTEQELTETVGGTQNSHSYHSETWHKSYSYSSQKNGSADFKLDFDLDAVFKSSKRSSFWSF